MIHTRLDAALTIAATTRDAGRGTYANIHFDTHEGHLRVMSTDTYQASITCVPDMAGVAPVVVGSITALREQAARGLDLATLGLPAGRWPADALTSMAAHVRALPSVDEDPRLPEHARGALDAITSTLGDAATIRTVATSRRARAVEITSAHTWALIMGGNASG